MKAFEYLRNFIAVVLVAAMLLYPVISLFEGVFSMGICEGFVAIMAFIIVVMVYGIADLKRSLELSEKLNEELNCTVRYLRDKLENKG